jgi:hypothetical protein
MRTVVDNLLFRRFDRLVREGELGKFEKWVGNLGCAIVIDQEAPLIVWWT